MKYLGLESIQRPKRKYNSYQGIIGKIADNLLKRDFKVDKPNQK
jgi:putative transposase